MKAKAAKANVYLRMSSEEQLATLIETLAPEAKKPVGMRARASIERENNFLILRVEAKDTVALRAALNAYLRWISSAVNVLEVIDHTS